MNCQGTKKCGTACSFKASIQCGDKFFCKTHAKSYHSRDEEPQRKPRETFWLYFISEDNRIPKQTKRKILTPEEKALMIMVNKFLESKLSPVELKKQGRALLLKIHPDKCRYENINSHILTQQILKHMNAT